MKRIPCFIYSTYVELPFQFYNLPIGYALNTYSGSLGIRVLTEVKYNFVEYKNNRLHLDECKKDYENLIRLIKDLK